MSFSCKVTRPYTQLSRRGKLVLSIPLSFEYKIIITVDVVATYIIWLGYLTAFSLATFSKYKKMLLIRTCVKNIIFYVLYLYTLYIYIYLRSPRCCCCSISDDLSCSYINTSPMMYPGTWRSPMDLLRIRFTDFYREWLIILKSRIISYTEPCQ